MKKTILTLSMLLASMGSAWANSGVRNALKIHAKSGTSVTILLDETPKVTFQGEDVVITTQKQVLSYPSAELALFTYEAVDATGINSVSAHSGLQVSFGEHTVSVSGLEAETSIGLYALDGKLLTSTLSNNHGIATLSLPEMPGNVYVLKTSSLTLKIRKP